MKQIPLTQGAFALVDDADYEELSKYKWSLFKSVEKHSKLRIRLYAQRGVLISKGKTKLILMHRQLTNAATGVLVDHENHNGLDNQRENLRTATPTQNSRNQRKRLSPTSSKFKGVSSNPQTIPPWRARICVNKKQIMLGYFDSEESAAHAYDVAALLHFGDFAHINFGSHTEELPMG